MLSAMSKGMDSCAGIAPLPLLLTALAAVLGASVALACGCGADGWAAACAAVLALLGHAVTQSRRAAIGADDAARRRRDLADIGAMVVVGGGTLVAARSGPGLLLLGAVALVLGWATRRPDAHPGPLGRALVAATGSWLTVLGVDQAHRHGLSAMGAILGGGLALLVASARLMDPRSNRPGAAVLLALAGQAWTLGWWMAGWLPTSAWWALTAAPLSLISSLAWALGRPRAASALAWLAAVLHGVLMTAALWAVVALR